MSEHLSDDALRAIEQGAPIVRLGIKMLEYGRDFATVRGDREFWMRTLDALMRADPGLYEALGRELGVLP